MTSRGLARFGSVAAAALVLTACNSVLGIEDLHTETRAGEDAIFRGGVSGSFGGANPSSGGMSASGGTAGAPVMGGTAGSHDSPPGGIANQAGGSDAARAGSAGSATESAGAVHGKLIDRFGAPVVNATVQIGESQVFSDEKGTFMVPDAASTYELSLLVDGAGWVFQGLTRRDPTLQVYDGRPDRYTYSEVTLANAAHETNDQISLAVGTASGSTEVGDVGVDAPVSVAPAWQGGTSTEGTVYALEWTKDATSSLPVSYKAFASKPLSLSATAEATVTLDLTPTPITSGAVSGLAMASGDGLRKNGAFVQFISGASIQVVSDAPASNAFSYVVPQLTGASVTLMAAEGPFEGPRGVAHKDGLAPGTTGVSLRIPAAPAILTPADGAKDVDQNTSFTFRGSADNAGAFVLIVHRLTSEPQKIYVVTTQTKLTLPSVVSGALTLNSGQNYEWWVETHGAFATVDEMAGPSGFIDEFGYHGSSPSGGHAADGAYTYSDVHQFTAK